MFCFDKCVPFCPLAFLPRANAARLKTNRCGVHRAQFQATKRLAMQVAVDFEVHLENLRGGLIGTWIARTQNGFPTPAIS